MVRGAARDHAGAMTTTPPPPEAPADPPTGGGTTTHTGPDAGPGSGPEGDTGPRVTAEEVRDLGRLRRTTTDRKVAGVAGGLARHLDVDPIILRVAFVVLDLLRRRRSDPVRRRLAAAARGRGGPGHPPPRRAQPHDRPRRTHGAGRARPRRRLVGCRLVPLAAGHHRADRLRLAQPQPGARRPTGGGDGRGGRAGPGGVLDLHPAAARPAQARPRSSSGSPCC